MNVQAGAKQDGIPVQQYPNPESDHSQFSIGEFDDGSFEIRNINSHKLLAVKGDSCELSAPIVQEHLNMAYRHMRFRIIPVPKNYVIPELLKVNVVIQNVHSDMFLNIAGPASRSDDLGKVRTIQ